MTLDIIVPRYKEPWELCRYLFDTLATQRGVPFENVHVIMVNDGGEDVLDSSVFEGLPFSVEYLIKPHGGVSDTRNAGLLHSTADYVMFCDADDGFLNNYGLYLLFSAMSENADYITSCFVEETFDQEGNNVIIRHDNDYTFMHGKAYKRTFLMEHELLFDPAMTIHEDGYFNTVAYVTAKHEGIVKVIDTPFYLWRWNDNSTVRREKEDFVLRTYQQLMQTRLGATEQLKKRGYEEEFRTTVGMTVLNSYYDFQKTSYCISKNAKYRMTAEKAFHTFWKAYKSVFNDLTNAEVSAIAVAARDNAVKNGMLFEQESLRNFLAGIEKTGTLNLN